MAAPTLDVSDQALASLVELRPALEELRQAIARVWLGKPAVVEKVLIGMLGQGHILIEDVPGVGKTLLAHTLALGIRGTFHRIQFTPDLLPSDILGTSLYGADTQEFLFKPGPVFAHVLLADEINRSSPRTQSALLESMGSAQVSLDGVTHPLPQPFLVLATQNPFEFEGTYALPESQLDRFMLRFAVGYPTRAQERVLLEQHRAGDPLATIEPVLTVEQVLQLQVATRAIRMEASVGEYILDIVHATREHPELQVGVSTRGALALYRAAQARALLLGRDFVVPDDVKEMAVSVLAHRIIGKFLLQQESTRHAEELLSRLLEEIAVPE